MLIRNLAQKTGVTSHTIRFYEKELLLDHRYIQRSDNNYRHYSHDAIERVMTIKLLQTAGFTLSEIKTHLTTWDAGELDIAEQITILRRKRDEIESKMASLAQVRDILVGKLTLLEEAIREDGLNTP